MRAALIYRDREWRSHEANFGAAAEAGEGGRRWVE